MKNTNYIRMQEGLKKLWKRKLLILFPIMYFLIIGGLSYAGEWLFNKMGSPFSSDLYLMIFYLFMIVILMVGLLGIVCILGTPINSKKIEGELVDIGFSDKDGNPPILVSKTNGPMSRFSTS